MAPSSRRGPGRSEAARVAILEATARIFLERGYEHLTMEGVAAEAGVGKQTIYRWWPSRTALVAECLAEGLIMPAWFVPPDSGDVRADLTTWLENVADFVAQPGNDALLRSLVEASAQDPAVATGLSERLGVLQLLGERMRRAVEAGDIDELPVEQLVEAMLGALVVRALQRGPIDRAYAGRLVALLMPPRAARD
ncbi:TetR/AcrR family transcriptional regulator [Protaetiibacter sp. SSC-01]|uniref:TetR/AcrR family transcriptional regulator n=1 Tax=Protaetiibacter sp. SSC-01 TaxID=2759943 RepID=UPI00165704F8|nr:TetR/AcrR family transcriptional regulator [Protaetiibacter sp. SSC-01]QNO37676.1 TetR/AcrR family transcriptional regulator [Protaetiibacter sp. SSC-01]